jgi:hypothetical protein
MGRGAYDTTDASAAKSTMAQAAIDWHKDAQARAEVMASNISQDTPSGLTKS